jgi:hypothetical protein
MRNFTLLGLMLFVALSCSACVATAAFAEEAEWLFNGEKLGGPQPVNVMTEFLLENTRTGAAMLCSARFDGTVGAGANDLIEKVLNLGSEEISSTPLTGLALSCLGENSCEATEDGIAWPTGLSWASLVTLTGGGAVLDATFEANWEWGCLELGIAVTEECSGSTSELMENVTGGVEGTFNGESEHMTCAVNKEEKTGIIEGKNTTTPAEGGTLTVS